MELYEFTLIFLLGIMVSLALAYIFNQQILDILNSFRTIPFFDRRGIPERRSMEERRSHQRGVLDRRQNLRRRTDNYTR